MVIIGTKEAFSKMINERGVHKKLGIEKGKVNNYRQYLKAGKLSLDKMEEMLLKYGATIVNEKSWEL